MDIKQNRITGKVVAEFAEYLRQQERAAHTVQKYVHDLEGLKAFLERKSLTKENLITWKNRLLRDYAPASVNSMLAAVNSFLTFFGRRELSLRLLKVQRAMFREESRELTRAEYVRLVQAAEREGNRRISLVLQTICATGIRVSELKFITAAAVNTGRAEISSKGKRRTVFLPEKLRRLLQGYLKKQKNTAGAVFVTRGGKPLDRSNIWRDMKGLWRSAGVNPEKVFPHNLRHLFARAYYAIEKDLSRLADILGHSSINTTRIYTMESGYVHARQVERLGFVLRC